MTVTLTMWSLLAVGLARIGLFHWWAALLSTFVACASGLVSWKIGSDTRRFQRQETLFLLILSAVSLILFAQPAEHFPQMGDASIYPNTAAKLIDTGALTYHYGPLDGLSPQQKQLFYVPSDEQLEYIDIESYRGLLYGAYYVMDVEENMIVSSRPPLLIAWMGLFGLLGGARGMLYVTPLFGVLSLIAVYFLGKRLFGAKTGAVAGMWLLVSFPQLYFSRTPFAEVAGQFFVLTAVYACVAYLQERQPAYIALGIGATAAGFAARLDILLAVPILVFFLFLLILDNDWTGLGTGVLGLLTGLGFTLWTANRPYVGATGELLLVGQLRFLRRVNPFLGLVVGLTGVVGAVFLIQIVQLLPRDASKRLRRLLRWVLTTAVILGVLYALHIRPLTAEYIMVDGEPFVTYNEELMAVAAQYMSYPFFWLAAAGLILVFWQRRIPFDHLLFVAFATLFAIAFFWKYTTARVYPVALRRLVPQVLPGCALLAAFAAQSLVSRGQLWKWMGAVVVGLVTVLLVSVAGPYWFVRGAEGAWDALSELADSVPSDAVVIFEPLTDGSVAGWFAAPLWSFHERDALLLRGDTLNVNVLTETICLWQDQNTDVYLVSQRAPSSWWPGEFDGRRQAAVEWSSSIIGQSQRFPPYVWRFSFTFPIYRLAEITCSERQ